MGLSSIQSIATIFHSLQAVRVPVIVIVIAAIPIHPAIDIPIHPANVTVASPKLIEAINLLDIFEPSFASLASHPW